VKLFENGFHGHGRAGYAGSQNACEKLPGRSPVDRAPNADIPRKSGEGSPPVGKNSN
jgi:hypothetical protein